MYQQAIQKVKGSIFPIFQLSKTGFAVVGTGFFIDNDGHFLTASHVISTLPPGTRFGYAGNVPHTNKTGGDFLPISIVQNDPVRDLALGKVAQGALPPLSFVGSSAVLGQSVVMTGYPLAVVKPQTIVNAAKKTVNVLDITNVRQFWQPTTMIDTLSKTQLINRPFHSFLTQDASLPGMSGGPIFDLHGDVVGVVSANVTRQIQRPNVIPLTIENGVGVDWVEIRTFLGKQLLFDSRLTPNPV